jgi:manganese/zinc/iron transport system permease protein
MSPWNWTLDGWVLVVGVLSACSCTLLGNYLVLRRMSLMGDAISHAVLPGLAIAFLISHSREPLPMFVGAVVVGALTALLTQAISRYGNVEEGAAMGVVFSILFAIGLILIRQAADHVDLDPSCVLMGNIESIGLDAMVERVPSAAVNLMIVMALNLLFVGLFYKELKICAFDPTLATTLGINSNVMHFALMIMVAITTVANFEIVGSILVIAMLIVPAATAYLLTDRLGVMILLSLIIAAACAVLGRILVVLGPGWFSIDASTNTAALMATIAGVFLALAVFFSPRDGIISRIYRRTALSLQIVREDILGFLYRWHELDANAARAVQRQDVLLALGDSLITKWALRSLVRRSRVQVASAPSGGEHLTLSRQGITEASRLIRSHRLWEAYLEKHFNLPLDHLHMPAERVEHYIDSDMRKRLDQDLTRRGRDPHGRDIPKEANDI